MDLAKQWRLTWEDGDQWQEEKLITISQASDGAMVQTMAMAVEWKGREDTEDTKKVNKWEDGVQ